MEMKQPLLAAIAAATAAGALAASVGATTTPGVVYPVRTLITGNGIVTIAKDKFTKGTLHRYPRGAMIRYEVFNKTKEVWAFWIWGARTTFIKPGKMDSILVNWNYRGTYTYRALGPKGQKGPLGEIEIF